MINTSFPPPGTLATASSTRQGHSEGILTLHDDPGAVADICFVHDLVGDRVGTWTAEGESEPWPKTLLPPLLGKVRVLSYGYNVKMASGSSGTTGNPDDRPANNLLIDLTMERIAGNASSRPLILVAHSLGGTICKEAVLLSRDNANSHLQGVYLSLKGIMFIGTPHKGLLFSATPVEGLQMSGWVSILTSWFGTSTIPKDYQISELDANSMRPEDTHERFKTLIEHQRDRGRPIVTQSFVEETLASKIGLTVSKESAALPDNEPIPINASHRDMVRFKSVHDAGFQKIINVLQLWIADIEDIRNTQPQADGSNNDSVQTGRSLNRGRLSRRMFIFPPSVRAPIQRPPSPLEIADMPIERPFRFRPCYIIWSIMALVVIGSGILGIYYTVRFDRMGDGFTAASWIVAIGVMALAGPMARHYPHCSCWRPTTPYYHGIHRASTLSVS